MYGYLTKYGYKGRMPFGEWRLFSTEEEYAEAYKEESDRIFKNSGMM